MNQPSPWLTLAGLGSALALFNFLGPPVIVVSGPGQAEMSAAMMAGIVAAEASLVATWCAFSCWGILLRWAVSAVVGLFLFACFGFGIVTAQRIASGGSQLEVVQAILFMLTSCPLVFFAVQLPLLAARTWLGWEIAEPDRPPRGSYLHPTRIKDIILGTAAAGAALSIVRLGPHLLPEENSPEEVLFGFLIFASCAAVGSLGALPPLVLLVMGTRQLAVGVTGVGIWCLGIVAIVTFALGMLAVGPSFGTIRLCTLVTCSFAAVFCTGLVIVRHAGYRLRGRRLAPRRGQGS